jgi:LytR cell envelope-related transcriptional attenuator
MTDQTEADSGHHRRPRKPRLGESRAPVTTIAVLIVATVAVVAGFLVLRSVTDPASGSDDATPEAATIVSSTPASTISAAPPPTTGGTSSTTTSSTTTLVPRASKSDATVVVANASGVDHSATAMTDELAADGYTTAPVANATGPYIERSIIYYLEGDVASQGVALLLAEQIPTARTLPMPDAPPLDRPLNGATVALLLGLDAAGRSLSDLATD